MKVEHHQGRDLLQSDGIVASTSYIKSLPLKIFFPSRFPARKALRFTSFSLPCSLTTLCLSKTPICFLPESIKDLSTLHNLHLYKCKKLQTLPELPSNLDSLNVSYCYSLRRIANPIPLIFASGCDQLVQLQDWIKLKLIKKADSHIFRIMDMFIIQMQPRKFEIQFTDNIFNVLLYVDEMLRWFCREEEEDGLIQNEFVEYFSFQISLPAAPQICGFDLFIRFPHTSEFKHVELIIKNETKVRSWTFYPTLLSIEKVKKFQYLWISHWKWRADHPTFDNGDKVSVSMLPHGIQRIQRVGVRWLYEEDGSDDNIQSNNEVITSHSSSSDREGITTHSNGDDDDVHRAKAEIASYIFRNYYCPLLVNSDTMEVTRWYFEKKDREVIEQ
ncbi:hypothetical protein SADUNF_Sadunf11G0006200 [Salix dunnii]|uniref:Uncharacterized protein n=1 Tax=Salix dunnii TaxID=1413687 RepID=A0A835JMW9_9ROSI|nr:hypothetical protein SADUNF_Sadunf11G0006200 [Salix dunnii]